ncbi:MAG: hypothetical protein GEV28_39475, partial [Actinophytocola sp.]|uniref:hypothetical protein n=1 Tax=Actinophytocola sp. TaxID=1872138 RepID=UPI0013217292
MTRAGEWALSVVAAAAFSAVWLVAVVSSKPGTFVEATVMLVWWAAMTTPGVFAARLLIRDTPTRTSTADGPDRLLATVTAFQAEHRREWGAAMSAELDAVPGRAQRWWFAAGCAWATLFPPREDRVWPAAALVVGATVGVALPAMTVFAVT